MARPSDAPSPRSAASRRWLRRRHVQVAIALGVLLVALRVVLPSIVRSQIEKQANAVVAGRLSVGDVDLWLLFGGVALEGVAFEAEGAAPAEAPLVAIKRLYVQVGYLPLLRHTLRIEDFALDGPSVHLERLRSGGVPLPGIRAEAPGAESTATSPTATTTLPSPASTGGAPWNVVVDRAVLRGGRFALRDHASEPPQTLALSIDELGLRNFTLRPSADAGRGRGTIEAKFGDGTVRIETRVATREEGFAVTAIVDVANLPLDRMHLHAPRLGWSDVTGRLDAHVTLTAPRPGSLPSIGGRVAIRDLGIAVPAESERALAWRALTVDLERIDVAQRRALVERVVLEGGSVIVTPKGPAPLPLLPRRSSPEPLAAQPETTEAASEPAAPWSWKVGVVEITDTRATVALEPPPLEIEITRATVTGLESTRGSRAKVDLELREEDGTIGLTGSVGLDPLGATLGAKVDGLGLGRLLAAGGAAPVQLPGGTLGANLTIQAEQGPLLVGGSLAISDLTVRLPQGGEDFAAGWKRLELDIKEVRVPGVLPGTAPAVPEPVRADLERLRLVAPVVGLTRAADGLVLPAMASASAPSESASAPPQPKEPPAGAGPGVALTLGRLDVESGLVSIVDRTVQPFYRGKVSAMTLTAVGLRYPENVFETIAFTANLPGGAPLTLDARQSKGIVSVVVDGRKLPLEQFNPYVRQAAGYGISGGTLNVGSRVRLDAKGFDSRTRVDLDQLGVVGAEGDSLFLEKVGIPLQLALSLLRDINGRIGLDILVAGTRDGMRIGLGSIVAQAVVKAILGAAMSPLKMLGSVADLATGGAGALVPEPIPCAAGLPDVDAAARERVAPLAAAMASAPALRITLRGNAGGADVRALQEAAVLADLEAKQGMLGTVRHLVNRAERNAIRDALAARARGDAADLEPQYQKALDEWAAAKAISDDQLRALASVRAEMLRATLVKEHGIEAARLPLGDPQVDREGGTPSVAIGLGG